MLFAGQIEADEGAVDVFLFFVVVAVVAEIFGVSHGLYHIVDVGDNYYPCARLDALVKEFAYSAFDIAYYFSAFVAAESLAQLVEVVAEKFERVFVDIEYLTVDIG